MRTLKALLASLMVLATLVTSSNAQCFVIDIEVNAQECKDADGLTYPMNSDWITENCEACVCKPHGISCCNFEKCEKVLHKSNCSYTVVEKNNPGKRCPVEGWLAT